MTVTKRRRLIEFFEEYEANFNSAILCDGPGAEASAAAFAKCFVGATPSGLVCRTNDDEFVRAIEQSCEQYRKLGTRAMRLEGIDTTPIDQNHVMARVHWKGEYRRPDSSQVEIAFDVVYFVRMVDDETAIFGYVTGDEQRALREHGLVE